jgi:hypothetical protein
MKEHPMKSTFPSLELLSMLIAAAAIISTGCVSDKVIKAAIDHPPALRLPARVTRPIDADLEKFGTMIRAYRTEDTDLIVAVDFMPNDSGISKELPEDIGSYARSVLEHIERPVVTYRTLPAAIGLKGPAANSIFLTGSSPKPPALAYKLVGVLERASEQVTAAKNARGDTKFGGGHTATDGSVTGDDTRTITSVTVSFTLETPDLLAVKGTSVAYRIPVEHRERNGSISIYVGGSGVGGGKRLAALRIWGTRCMTISLQVLWPLWATHCLFHTTGSVAFLSAIRNSTSASGRAWIAGHGRSWNKTSKRISSSTDTTRWI